MPEIQNIVIIQTAFPGDVILTLPLAQSLKRLLPAAGIDMVVTPRASTLLTGHPAIREVLVYDKRGVDSGVRGFFRQQSILRTRSYDCALIPHRSFRSAALAAISGIPRRIGFNTSAGRMFLTNRVPYESTAYEIDRNLQLLSALGFPHEREYPRLYPSHDDCSIVDGILSSKNISRPDVLVGIAPGTVWNTKQWIPGKFKALVERCVESGYAVALIGGKEDEELCGSLLENVRSEKACSCAGKLTFLQSAELIRRCSVLVSNDSAPMHIAVGMQTPVVAIFGATVPAFGFAPRGEHDVVIETPGLSCRPCSIHGGKRCPIGTFDCMNNITVGNVFDQVLNVLHSRQTQR